MTDLFADKLREIVLAEVMAANNDPPRFAEMLEGLAKALGFAISVATRGDPKGIDEMIEGATSYAHEEAVAKARFAKLLG
jgi:hypothetical protein